MFQTKQLSNARMKLAGLAAGATSLWQSAILAYATTTGDNPFAPAESKITSIFVSLRTTLTNVVGPIAGCALVFCFIMMLVSQNQKKVEAYRGWAITIFVCIVAIYAVDFIVSLATGIGQSL